MATDYLWFEGIPLPTNGFSIENMKYCRDEFVVRDEDVIMVTYPKSGSHWLAEIVSFICSKGDTNWIQSVFLWDRTPWIETTYGTTSVANQQGPRTYNSHLPIQLFPKSLFVSKAKVIYLIRNPRDIITSGYHFFRALKTVKNPDSFEQYLEWFFQGNVMFGSWFDHIQGWLSMKGKENFLIISYEEMKQDTRAAIERITQFLGKELSPEELNSILKNVSFEVMKENKMSNFSQVPDKVMDHTKGKLMRKGVTGDWKNHFTVAQSEAFDRIYKEKMGNLPQGLFPWE